MIDYSEKRDFQRMQMDCSMQFSVAGDEKKWQAHIINLSATGVLFIAEIALPEGSRASIYLSPVHTITPPLCADIEVIRCVAQAEQAFKIAAHIVNIEELE
ncbi:MAG: PilZ domain-containing protein [Gammaproteobacteria bacterium]|nr:PilZ domain-containing protein [Gammaproteobacteria bacterium]MBL6999827.1 PilZ domain-containing protein [Gammaproteobacteria bacterium]